MGAYRSFFREFDRISEPANPGPAIAAACTDYRAGWIENSYTSTWGGYQYYVPYEPVSFTSMCAGYGHGYTDGVSFGANSWIQAGIAQYASDHGAGIDGAKWFCQSNNNGVLDTRFGPANQYTSGIGVDTWFDRDSAGIWHTYRYDTGPYSIELGCTISRGAGQAVQHFGELQGATSTLQQMGPWHLSDFKVRSATDGVWYQPSQVYAFYASTPCPPYGSDWPPGAGVVLPGSGQHCTPGGVLYGYPNG